MATNVINIREFVDVSTSVSASGTNVARDWTAVLFVQKGTDAQATTISKYDDLAAVITGEGSNTEAAKFATQFYGTGYNGLLPVGPMYVATIGCGSDEFADNFAALLLSEDYYMIALDTNITDAQKKAAAALTQGANATAAHKLFLDDLSTSAFDLSLEADLALEGSCSVSAYCRNANYTHVIVCAINPSNTNKYYSASNMAFWATRKFENSSRRMCSIAHKPASGVQPVDMTDTNFSASVTPTQKFKNLDEKNANVYINVKIVGLPAWERGNLPSGDDISEFISADYLTYVLSVSVFRLLQTTPRLPMNTEGATMLGNVISQAFLELNSAGVISGGVAEDGDVFPTTGYKYSIPIPTGVKKANGLWDGIVCSALLTGTAKKVVIGNELKK
jgi:hypothetical protein